MITSRLPKISLECRICSCRRAYKMEWRIPLSDIDFGPEEASAVQAVVESRWLTMGGMTEEFEREFAAYVGARHAIAVTNATAALHLACLVAGLGPGDEAVVPSLTFVATAN